MIDHETVAATVSRVVEDEALPALTAYAGIPSLSPDFDPSWEEHGHIAAAAELLASWAAARPVAGLTVELVALPGRTPLIWCEVPPSAGAGAEAGTVLVYGHLDKQPQMGEWLPGLGPFTPVRRGDRLYGRGTADDGYAVFAALAAVEALQAAGGSHARCVVLIEASEESGSPDLPAHLDALGGRIGDPTLVVCLDSGCLTYDRLWVTTSLRGNLVGRLRVEVLREGVHSGSAGGVVPSSFRLLRQLLSRIEDESTGEILLPELHEQTPAHRIGEIAALVGELGTDAVGHYPAVEGLRLAGDSLGEQVVLRTRKPSLSVTGMDGIPSCADGGSVLRPFTTAKLSLRLPPLCDPDAALAAVQKALTSDPPEGAEVSFEGDAAAGWDSPEPAAWLAAAADEASSAYFGRPARSCGEGGTIPFLTMLGTRYPGAQFLATGVLGPESNAHGPNEFLHIPTMKSVAACVAHMLDAHARRAT